MPIAAYAAEYDDLPYAARAIPQAHFEHLAVLGRLNGLEVVPPATCRVLDIGAADGAHLVPQALAHPQAEFVGVDVSAPQVERGRARILALGLRNVQLLVADVAALPASLGQFDYVSAHGVYSWVPPAVRAALLEVFRERLTPRGIGYVSYKTLPGCAVADAARRLLLAQLSGVQRVQERVERARALAASWKVALEPQAAATGGLAAEFARIAGASDSAIAHDWLEPFSDPVYVRDFLAELDVRGLRYVGEAVLGKDAPESLPPSARSWFDAQGSDVALRQQTLDALLGRRIRHSLVTRGDTRSVSEAQRADASRVASCFVGCSAKVEARGANLRVELAGGAVAHLSPPVAELVARVARAFPEFLSVDSLVSTLPTEMRRSALGALEALFRAGLVELRLQAPGCVREPSTRPRATALARLEAQAGPWVTNQHHVPVHITEPSLLQLLAHCDGTSDTGELSRRTGLRPAACNAGLAQLARFALLEA